MCGLIGGTNPNWSYTAAIERLQHRGPDSTLSLNVDGVTMGFSRLAVVDTSRSADQPMLSKDGDVCLVFNGEIYDQQTLRSQLQVLGHKFLTQSDSETVLNAYIQWGADFVDRIDGMFAIAIYDRRRNRIHLYRDRPGIKPLYYLWDGSNFAFVSELKALETLVGQHTLKTDESAFYDFLTYGYIPTPKSKYQNVFKLPAATHLQFDVQQCRIESSRYYWRLPTDVRSVKDIDSVSEELTEVIHQSVREQLVADVPVGCFLSGGMDSSIVVAHAAALYNGLQTFSVGFDDAQHSETKYARLVADEFQTQHHELRYELQSPEEQLAQLQSLYDEPFADTSAFPTFTVSEFARRHVTVALSGDGGDELFGGYKWYRRYEKLRGLGAARLPGPHLTFSRWHDRLPVGSRRRKVAFAAGLLCSDPLSLYLEVMGAPSAARRAVFAEHLNIDADYDDAWHFRQHWRPDLPLLTRLQYLDFHTYLPDDILTKVDRASMAHSLEVRVPLLSRKLIEFAFALPESVRYHEGHLKGVLKHAYRQTLPTSILQRPKRGFSTPPSHLSGYDGRLRERIAAVFLTEDLPVALKPLS